jgi:hypothetical protein
MGDAPRHVAQEFTAPHKNPPLSEALQKRHPARQLFDPGLMTHL